MKVIGYKVGEVVKMSPTGQVLNMRDGECMVELTRPRNYEFHKKYFALLNAGYDLWDCPGDAKDFDAFREDIIVAAGYFTIVMGVNGVFKLKAKSISFAKMEEIEFSELYNKTIDTILWKALPQMDRDALVKAEDQILAFV